MRLLAISGSLRRASINTAVLEALSRVVPDGVEIAIYREMGALPHFNPDDDGDAPPPSVISLRKSVGASDGLLIVAPEYSHGAPGALKNVLDWLVASFEIPGKPVALINAAPRAHHAQSALREILTTMSVRIVPETLVLPPPPAEGVDPALAQALRAGLDRVVAAMRGDAG